MKKGFRKSLSLILGIAMIVGSLTACGKTADTTSASDSAVVSTDTTSTETSTTPSTETKEDKILVVGYDQFASKFSPFFATLAYDQDVASMVSMGLLMSDREGNVLLNGIEGDVVKYNGTDYTYKGIADCKITENADGTVVYDFTMRDDIVFSDGVKITADDVIFSMYVYSDPTYDGASTFYTLPIKGMEEYRGGMSTLFNLLAEAGRDNADFTNWDEATQKAFWEDIDQAGAQFVQEIVDYCIAKGYNDAADPAGVVIATWGFDAPEDATTVDIFHIMEDAYAGDLADLSDTESAGTALVDFMNDYDRFSVGVATGESAANIAGIEKTGDYSIRVTMEKLDATAIYHLPVTVAPLHYYGDTALYDYANNKFGFVKGDMSLIKKNTTKPLGAGPYKFVSYENGIVTFEANENYYLGCPKTKYIQFKETPESDKLTGVASGTFDISDPSMNLEVLKNIKGYNSNGSIIGETLTTNLVDNLGYGYIGISANNVNVGGEAGSEASKNLRKAFATLFAAYRDTVINSYYGEMATVIQYPMSNTSWAAPKPADEGYKIAYSVDVNGNSIYTADMTDEQKYAAALDAAVGFLKAAGYTFDEASGKFTAAPAGAEMTYEAIVPGGGQGDHPAYGILTGAKEALASVGITLEINDPSDNSVWNNAMEANTAEIWAAAWGATVDPDMYQVYHSDNALGNGTNSNHYAIQSEKLDTLIMAARNSADQSYRKATYKECLEEILDWGVEVPTYQRQNAVVFSTQRVNMSTVTPDITTFWGWMNDLQLLEMN